VDTAMTRTTMVTDAAIHEGGRGVVGREGIVAPATVTTVADDGTVGLAGNGGLMYVGGPGERLRVDILVCASILPHRRILLFINLCRDNVGEPNLYDAHVALYICSQCSLQDCLYK